MQSLRSWEDHEAVAAASLSRARRKEANALVLELADLLFDGSARPQAYDRQYLGRLLIELMQVADGAARKEAMRRLEAGTADDSDVQPWTRRQQRNAVLTGHDQKESGRMRAPAGQGGVEPVRAAPLLTGWKSIIVLAGLLLLTAGTLALANQDDSDGERREISPSAIANPDSRAYVDPGDGGLTPPAFDIARISRDGVGVLAGRAMPGSRVRVLADGSPWASVRADARGEWALILDKPLKAGLSALALETRVDGEILPSPNTLVIMRPDRGDTGKAGVTDFATGPDVLAVLTPRAGAQASRVLQKPDEPHATSGATLPRVETVEFDTSGRGVVTGRAPASHRVAVRLNGEMVAQLRADAQGRWMLALDSKLSPGAHRLEVENLDEKGRALARNIQSFKVGDLVAPPPGGRGIALEMRQAFWAMVRASAGMERRYTLIFRDGADRMLDAASAAGIR